jgi:hypothetical protein
MDEKIEQRTATDLFFRDLLVSESARIADQKFSFSEYEQNIILHRAEKLFLSVESDNMAVANYRAFIGQELKLHPEYDIRKDCGNGTPNLVYLDLLADKLYLFSLLTGARMLKLDFPHKDTYIKPDNPESLRLFGSKGGERIMWDAKELFDIYIRRNNASKLAKKEGLDGIGTYVFHLKEVLETPSVVALFGRISYDENVTTKHIKKRNRLSGNDFTVRPEREYVGPFEPQMLSYDRRGRGSYTGKFE